MFANPIIRRYRFSQLRSQQVWVFGSLYVCIVLLILFINSSIYRYGEGAYTELTDLYKGLFVQFAILEVFLLWLLCPANCSNVVAREIADKSFDFFRMLPVSASKKAVGILTGRNLFCLIVAVINLGLCGLFGIIAELPAALLLQMLALLLSLTLTLNLLALLFSILSYKKTKSSGSIPVLIIIGIFAFGPVMGMMIGAVDEHRDIESTAAFFYTLQLPVLYLVAGCALFAAVWAYIGILRRFTREYEALFSRIGGPLFLVTFIAVFLGLFFKELYPEVVPESYNGRVEFFWMFSMVPVWIIPLFSLRSFDTYLEITRSAHRVEGLIGRLLASSNIISGVLLFAIWLAFAVPVGLTVHADMMQFLCFALMMATAFLVILALLETYAMWQPRNEKIGYLLGFLGILYFGLPLVLGAIFEVEEFFLFGPFGAVNLFSETYAIPTLLMPVLFNLVCLLPLGILIGKRYYDLVTLRMQMHHQAASAISPPGLTCPPTDERTEHK